MKSYRLLIFLFFVLTAVVSNSYAYDINDKFSIGGIMVSVYQHQWVDGDGDKGRGAFNFEPEISFQPNEQNEFFAKFGFGAGSGPNGEANPTPET